MSGCAWFHLLSISLSVTKSSGYSSRHMIISADMDKMKGDTTFLTRLGNTSRASVVIRSCWIAPADVIPQTGIGVISQESFATFQ